VAPDFLAYLQFCFAAETACLLMMCLIQNNQFEDWHIQQQSFVSSEGVEDAPPRRHQRKPKLRKGFWGGRIIIFHTYVGVKDL